MYRTYALASILVVAALGVSACGDDDKEDSTSSGTKTEETYGGSGSSKGEAEVTFVEPKQDGSVASKFTARVKLEDFKLDAKNVGKKPKEGNGHVHFSLDNGKYDTPKYSGENGKLAVKLGVDGKYSPSVAPTIAYNSIPAGEHMLKAELVDNSHRPIGSEAETTFTVK